MCLARRDKSFYHFHLRLSNNNSVINTQFVTCYNYLANSPFLGCLDWYLPGLVKKRVLSPCSWRKTWERNLFFLHKNNSRIVLPSILAFFCKNNLRIASPSIVAWVNSPLSQRNIGSNPDGPPDSTFFLLTILKKKKKFFFLAFF